MMETESLADRLERLGREAVEMPWTVTHTATRKLMACIEGASGQTVALIGAIEPDEANATAELMETLVANLPTVVSLLRLMENPDTLTSRLAHCLAECIDQPLLMVGDPEGNEHEIGLRLSSFKPDLANRAAGLLEEVGQ